MLCPKCGTENTDTSKFCVKCGTKMTAAEADLAQAPPVAAPPAANPPETAPLQPRRRPNKIAVGLGVLVLAAVVYGLVTLFVPLWLMGRAERRFQAHDFKGSVSDWSVSLGLLALMPIKHGVPYWAYRSRSRAYFMLGKTNEAVRDYRRSAQAPVGSEDRDEGPEGASEDQYYSLKVANLALSSYLHSLGSRDKVHADPKYVDFLKTVRLLNRLDPHGKLGGNRDTEWDEAFRYWTPPGK